MNYNSLLYKNSSIFLVTILVTGIIGISFHLSAFAQDQSQPTITVVFAPLATCDNTNLNINDIVQTIPQINKEPQTTLNTQQIIPEKVLNPLLGSNGNGEPLLNLEKDIVNVCVNNNNNDVQSESETETEQDLKQK